MLFTEKALAHTILAILTEGTMAEEVMVTAAGAMVTVEVATAAEAVMAVTTSERTLTDGLGDG
jgi:hypothetical protein